MKALRSFFSRVKRTPQLKKRLYIHIGTHKTGTTSIQDFLSRNADELAQSGIYVPTTGRLWEHSGHHSIAWEFLGHALFDPKKGTLKDLLNEIRSVRQETIVISSEEFEFLNLHAVRLKEMVAQLSDFDVQFIIYLRNPADYLRSLQSEMKKHNFHRSDEWYAEQIREAKGIRQNPKRFYDFDYDRLTSSWREVTGQKLITCDYDACTAGDGVLPSFCKLIGASQKVVERSLSTPRLNVSAAPSVVGEQ